MHVVACILMESLGIVTERARLPHLWGQPFVLADTSGQILATSPECFPFGIRTGMPVATARALCEGLIVLPYQRAQYMLAAERFWDAIAAETSVVEPVSPELVFALLSGTDLFLRARALARGIAEAATTDVKIGLGRSKLVAEHAARQDSSSRVVAVKVGQEPRAIADIPLTRLAVLDAKLVQRFAKLGVQTLGDITTIPEAELVRSFKTVGHLLRQLSFGIDGDEVRPLWPKPTVQSAISFDDAVTHDDQITLALHTLAERIVRDLLRRETLRQSYCRSLRLQVTMESAQCVDLTEELTAPSHDASVLNLAANRLFERLRGQIDQPVVGLELTGFGLDAGSQNQLTFLAFDEIAAKREKHAVLDATLTRLWRAHGPRAVLTAALLAQAKRIHLWTHTLAKQRSEPVQVYTSPDGAPVRYLRTRRRGQRGDVGSYSVASVLDQWHTADWRWGELIERECWRVLSTPEGLHELHRLDVTWLLAAEAD